MIVLRGKEAGEVRAEGVSKGEHSTFSSRPNLS